MNRSASRRSSRSRITPGGTVNSTASQDGAASDKSKAHQNKNCTTTTATTIISQMQQLL